MTNNPNLTPLFFLAYFWAFIWSLVAFIILISVIYFSYTTIRNIVQSHSEMYLTIEKEMK